MAADKKRFPMLISSLGHLFLIPFGVTGRRAFLQIADGQLHVRFGPIVDHRFPVSEVEEAAVVQWPRWAGIGPRFNLRGAVGLVGAYANTVRLTFKTPQKVRVFLTTLNCERLYVSLEDPEEFITTLGETHHPSARRAKAA